ncbi:MAG: hypothetical protein HZB59_00725 [Ignavibacteriales bacterium]|nr:hypothetical protein [Ignavibacteriales bacterium]
MTVDELQHWASVLRWVGLSVTAVGLLITFGSYYVADKLLVVQRADKLKAQERLNATEAELKQTKIKTAELEHRLAPRTLTTEQRERFIKFLSKTTKGPVALEHSGQAAETIKFTEEIRSLLVSAGFTISAYNMPLGYVFKEAPDPWFITVIVGSGQHPAYADQLLLAFKDIGINALAGDGTNIANPGEVKVFVGAK